MKLILKQSDKLGALSSSLCLVHCLATPFLFIVHASSACCSEKVPLWWNLVDYIFLAISFVAVYHSSQTTNSNIMSRLLWLSWGLLFLSIVNERMGWLVLPETVNYLPAVVLTGLHIYNLKYCQCKTDKCCINNG